MKALIVDIDGVLCVGNDPDLLDIYPLKNLYRVINKTGSVVVISSTWRTKPQWLELGTRQLNAIGIEIYGCTPIFRYTDHNDCSRAAEIRQFLKDNPDIDKFAIIDDYDEACLEEKPESFFLTSYEGCGLNNEIADKIIDYLNGG